MNNSVLLGVDTGGTFTDFVLWDGGRLVVHKVLSTPEAPERAILQGVRDLGVIDCLAGRPFYLVHGSTVATNAVLEAKGVRTAYVTNRGLADVLTIGRQARRQLYELQPEPVAPPVPEELCIELDVRLAADGTELQGVDEAKLALLRKQIENLAPRAVAVNLLFSFLDPAQEQAVASALPENLFVSCSSEVLPEVKEYERGIATWLNAWVGPLMQSYLRRLTDALPQARIAVMQSSGGTIAAEQAGRHAVRLLLSGPAGGIAGARQMAGLAACERLLTFDMGGTSTDVALIDGEPRLTSEGRIGHYPVAVPMLDIHTIGAGGGSIARVDAGGLLLVGPESAGAMPGPACYGQGGTLPTVTDANLVLGRLVAGRFLGGRMALDVDAARAALKPIADRLALSVELAALGVVELANEHMAQALRLMSVQKGVDARELTLVSFGGAGGLHVCALAEALGMRKALQPRYAGVLSALGMLAAERERRLSRTLPSPLLECDEGQLLSVLEQLASQGGDELVAEGVAAGQIAQSFSLDLRYQGQSYTLNVPWLGKDDSIENFHEIHEHLYGHRLETAVELVNVRVRVWAPAPMLDLQALATGESVSRDLQSALVYGIAQPVQVVARDTLVADEVVFGPALITETVATTYLASGWQARCDRYGNLLLQQQQGGQA